MKKKMVSLIMSATLLVGLMPVNIKAQELDEEQMQMEATSSDAYELNVMETEGEILVEDTLEVEANQVLINADNFPDENFRKYIKENFDKNNDDIVDDIENITIMSVYGRRIYSLKGIEFFFALVNFNCGYNYLTSLDVSKNTSLKYLDCGGNHLTSLDVSKNTALKQLDCDVNCLTSLDVSKNMSLERLSCGGNQLTSLDVSKNTSLVYLDCNENQLTSLDVSKNKSLNSLSCSGNQLINLDVSKNKSLQSLQIDSNMTMDISDNHLLFLYISVPQLKGTIDLSNIKGIERYMSGWNASTKKLTYELEIRDDYYAGYEVSEDIKLVLGNVGLFSNYQGCSFSKNVYGDVICYDSIGDPVINDFKCDGTYTYYFQADGTAMKNRLTYHPDGKHIIYFDEDGHEVFSNFHHVEKSIAGDAVDDLCFFDVYGYMYVDVMTYDQAGEKLYYVSPYGVIEQNKWFEFSDTCVWAGTTNKVGKGYGYANADGTLMVNTHTYDWRGNFVYLQGDGHMK
ncbi:MAG: hypothetical protein NC393_08640 [Clostridium sp.]|nr:hypothetical protein [Clostridium sp.]MCM1209671.1 hypothetical protein [Ruminococcus sp.]